MAVLSSTSLFHHTFLNCQVLLKPSFKMFPLLSFHCSHASSSCFYSFLKYLFTETQPITGSTAVFLNHCLDHTVQLLKKCPWLHAAYIIGLSDTVEDSQLYLNLIVAWGLLIKKNYPSCAFLAHSDSPIILLNISSLVSCPINEPSHWLKFYPSLLFFPQSIL